MAHRACIWNRAAVWGLVTNAAVSILGGILAAAAGVGWFRDVLPFEAHEMVTVTGGGTGRHNKQTWSRTDRGCAGIAQGVLASGNLSGFSRGQGRSGRERGDGGHGDALRRAKP